MSSWPIPFFSYKESLTRKLSAEIVTGLSSKVTLPIEKSDIDHQVQAEGAFTGFLKSEKGLPCTTGKTIGNYSK